MARAARIDVPHCPQHLWVRGHNRSVLFRDDKERWLYLNELQRALLEYGCDLHAYVLMTNHVHLLVTSHMQGAMSRLMQRVGGRFACWVNVRHRTSGAVFGGRYKSSVIDSKSYLLTCMRYIEENPVRASMVGHPSDYAWSSYSANASGCPGAPLTPHELYLGLGRDAASRGKSYAGLFGKPILDVQLAAIRASLTKDRALGSPEFLDRLENELGRSASPAAHGGDRRSERPVDQGDRALALSP